MRRGEVWTTNSVIEGREVSHLVITNDLYNAGGFATVLVMNIDDRGIRDNPVSVSIESPVGGNVLVDRVEYFLRDNLVRCIGEVDREVMDAINRKLVALVGP
jgi:mRNA-degrading endonuclease toxin of MazEF toxin-antitoxin module